MDYDKGILRLHSEWRGKLEVTPRAQVDSKEALSLAYTPGVAQPCLEIQKDISKSYELTRRWNTVAVVTDGSAVLGLGDIGPEAGMPVMEGKCVLFKAFGGVDAIPLCVRSHDVDEIVNTVALLAGSFGGVNLEDIAAPRCFEIERKLKERCDIPIFHDDQHGTAIVATAALINALKALAGIPQETDLVSAAAIEPIQTLKTNYLGSKNPRLHTDEILIALSSSAAQNPTAAAALKQLSHLKGCDMHSTVILSSVDMDTVKKLGMYLTCEPTYEEADRMYHKK